MHDEYRYPGSRRAKSWWQNRSKRRHANRASSAPVISGFRLPSHEPWYRATPTAIFGMGVTSLWFCSISAILTFGCVQSPGTTNFEFGLLDGEQTGPRSDADIEALDMGSVVGNRRDAAMETDTSSLIVAPGPSPELFDCRSARAAVDRTSSVPLTCMLDPDCNEPMVIGHRGVGGDFGTIAPENSLSAIGAAIVLGLDGVELDVRLTRDEGLVLMHDRDVERTTNGSGLVSDMTQTMLTGLTLNAPRLGDGRGDFSCDRVPSLEDALRAIDGRLIALLNTHTDRLDLIAALIERLNLYDSVLIIVSDGTLLRILRSEHPRVNIAFNVDSQSHFDELLSQEPGHRPQVILAPASEVGAMNSLIHEVGAKSMIDAIGLDIVASISHDLQGYRDAYESGIDLIQTEYPQLVMESLGRWRPSD